MRRIALALLLVLAWATPSPAERMVVAVIKSRDIPPYNQAIRGFEDFLKGKGVAPWFVSYDIGAAGEKPAGVMEEVRQKKPDLILTLGTRATEEASAWIGDTPIVFGVLLNPGEWIKKKNVTGALMDIPFRKQFEAMLTVLPKARSVGMLFSPEETGPVAEEAAEAARAMGLTLVAVPVGSEKEVPDRLKEVVGKIDALWMIADSKVYTSRSTEFILQYTLKQEVPFIGLSAKYVKAGALMAISWDYADLGAQAGELAWRIIGGSAPADLPMTIPRKTPLVLNLRTARTLGLKIPRMVVDRAEEVYE